ncbi:MULTISPECIES: DUF4114 domain-containing protein [unclassified Oceanispirochaeta]|uniref:DUF4114 domain-containing protein n=1 Tax=unclassified Oceanispirochaeta TaxID=2635722 RepID=UPI000E094B3D|nr:MULTISPECIES: DUF4114 domain-containing protein [unclassified Oceanispirochaeta]MBF9018790.1 DUF4114 domain-containing protein [Oceanispirochaeta sp. M2]NPD75259.1 DUF4114 domain-containing protein [Oceanispirochaeta sp. M1]RDG28895.1 DUF4114 domain-containing protein [Oceanispirochaeta sp. M1]
MKSNIQLIIITIIFAASSMAISADGFQSDIHLGIPPSIIAHPAGNTIFISSSVLSSSPATAIAEGEGYIGYFDCNMPATLSYQANSPHSSQEPNPDIIPTVYDLRLYGHGGDDIFYTSPSVEQKDIILLPGSTSITSTTGEIHAELNVSAEVGWEHDAGEYTAVFIITAVQIGGITIEEVNLYKSFFAERGLPDPAIIAPGTDPNLYLSSDISMSSIFIGEGAGYRNRAGYFLFGDLEEPLPGTMSVIYENASMAGSGGQLMPGDTAPVGIFNSDNNIGFWLQSNGYSNPSSPYYYTFDNSNSDSLRHAAIFSDIERERIIIGWEDLPGGGDKDYNDVLFALDISPFSALDLSNIPDVSELGNQGGPDD